MFKVSTQVRYGMRALVRIAEAPPGRAVPIRQIAREQRLSMKYLERIVSSLRSSGLIRSVRGTRGGYVLARPARSVRLDEVVRVLQGPPVVAECVDRPRSCDRHESCATRDVWVRIRRAIDGVLTSITLEDLVETSRGRGKATANYSI